MNLSNVLTRFSLSMGLSAALIGYAFWVSLSGMAHYREEVKRIFDKDQPLVAAYQNIYPVHFLKRWPFAIFSLIRRTRLPRTISSNSGE